MEAIEDLSQQQQLKSNLVSFKIPENLHDGILRWVMHHIPPGGFLQHIIANNLYGTVCKADIISLSYLKEICSFFINCVPENAFGSSDKLVSWCHPDRISSLEEIGAKLIVSLKSTANG